MTYQDPNSANDARYWDEYVRRWEQSAQSAQYDVLGREWKNEEIFLSLLRKHGSSERVALEIGCGGGRITKSAVGVFGHVHATDISPEMLRKCAESVNADNLSLHQSDGFTLKEFADTSMDTVFAHDVFVHFSSLQVYPYLTEIRRILRPGGEALVSFYHFATHFALFKAMSLQFWERRVFPPHMRIHFVTEEMVRLMLQDLGLEIVEIEKTNYLIVAFRRP